MFKITEPEYKLMRQYIEDQCGIYLEEGKEYLIESRLMDLVIENGCTSFHEFFTKARSDHSAGLKNQIIDAMTTNETSWFRDDSSWKYLQEVAVPEILGRASSEGKTRIWSAAASTGQEAYSLLMLIDEAVNERGISSYWDRVDIIATDISFSALILASSAKYNEIAMSRSLPEDKKERYFIKQGNIWHFDCELKQRVWFKQFNLQNDFSPLGIFDLILCRYVIIYFSDTFKKELFKKIAGALVPGGILLLGSSESVRGFSDDFEITYYDNAVINIRK